MSLVTAKIVEEHIFCVGDTKITYATDINSNPILSGCIKQYLFNNLLICFAGSVYAFEQNIEKYRNYTTLGEVIEIAANSAIEYELLAASYNPCRIVIVKNKIVSEVTAGFIGDNDAFKQYQTHYHDPKQQFNAPGSGEINIFQLPEPAVNTEDYTRMYKAMKEVVSGSAAA